MYAIFYKEWIKTRWYFLLAVVTTLGFTGYCMLRINRVIEMKGAEHVWVPSEGTRTEKRLSGEEILRRRKYIVIPVFVLVFLAVLY